MKPEQQKAFIYLKELLVDKMKQHNSATPDQIADWKGQNIIDFQNQLLEEQKAQISEKWFYTHMKKDHNVLPRIDVLNILCKFVGYKGWQEFLYVYNHKEEDSVTPTKDRSNKVFIWIPILTIIILIMVILFVVKFN